MILRRLWKVLGYKYIDKLDYLHTHIHIVFCKHINNNAFAKLNRFEKRKTRNFAEMQIMEKWFFTKTNEILK